MQLRGGGENPLIWLQREAKMLPGSRGVRLADMTVLQILNAAFVVQQDTRLVTAVQQRNPSCLKSLFPVESMMCSCL